ncbi:MAG: sortase [Chloroflexi bacterium]|nr:sortase [Chloroflexota bacterium]
MDMVSVPGALRQAPRLVAWAFVLLGAGLALLGVGYLGYSKLATRGLAGLTFTQGLPSQGVQGPATLTDLAAAGTAGGAGQSSSESGAAANPAAFALYPGALLPFQAWAQPWAPPLEEYEYSELVRGFAPVSPRGLAPVGTLPQATRMWIPSIEVDAQVEDLAIRDLGDSREYETPNRVVGHIPTTANPGEGGTGWYFGHLATPIINEGSVFRDLPRTPELLRKGERVFIVLESPRGSYLFEAFPEGTYVVPKEDLRITESDRASITLVTCVPLFTYSHRLVVNAELVGFKLSG